MHDPYKGKAIFWNFLVDQATTISQSLKYLMNYSQILISFIEKWLYDWKTNFISLGLYDFVRVMLVTDLDSGWHNFVDAEICHQYLELVSNIDIVPDIPTFLVVVHMDSS